MKAIKFAIVIASQNLDCLLTVKLRI